MTDNSYNNTNHSNQKASYCFDFSDVPSQDEYTIIPDGTIVKVNMTITRGGHDDLARGWDGGIVTKNLSGSCYLKVKFKVLDGEFKGRQILGLIGLHSNKGPEYENMGKSFMKTILESAHGISSKDKSEKANKLRVLRSLADLDNINFVAKVSVGENAHGNPKNEIKYAITVDNPNYIKVDQESEEEPF
jgi:hypothetical protein